ncbi:hypothetical protein [Streptomyces sp. NPDC020983]|uniref:hypothetical protein n=1 Tax=Streptomyces sp. NPDC020983 TaxID=3365106 RepID=UPI0037B8BC01
MLVTRKERSPAAARAGVAVLSLAGAKVQAAEAFGELKDEPSELPRRASVRVRAARGREARSARGGRPVPHAGQSGRHGRPSTSGSSGAAAPSPG